MALSDLSIAQRICLDRAAMEDALNAKFSAAFGGTQFMVHNDAVTIVAADGVSFQFGPALVPGASGHKKPSLFLNGKLLLGSLAALVEELDCTLGPSLAGATFTTRKAYGGLRITAADDVTVLSLDVDLERPFLMVDDESVPYLYP